MFHYVVFRGYIRLSCVEILPNFEYFFVVLLKCTKDLNCPELIYLFLLLSFLESFLPLG